MFATVRLRLRPAAPDDAPGLYELRGDPENHLLASGGPFVPRSLASVRLELEKELSEPSEKFAGFIAESIADATMLGRCALWGIDSFSREAHVGMSLLPAARGHGYGRDMLELLCRFGFRIRNLRRLEIETNATNVSMRKTAEACGFVHEGTQREKAWTGDGYGDIAIYGLLRTEWSDRGVPAGTAP